LRFGTHLSPARESAVEHDFQWIVVRLDDITQSYLLGRTSQRVAARRKDNRKAGAKAVRNSKKESDYRRNSAVSDRLSG
jgi:hypothetical protein